MKIGWEGILGFIIVYEGVIHIVQQYLHATLVQFSVIINIIDMYMFMLK